MLLMRQHISYHWLFRAKQASQTDMEMMSDWTMKSNKMTVQPDYHLHLSHQRKELQRYSTSTHRDHNIRYGQISPDWTGVWLSECYYIIGKRPCHRGWSVKDSGTESTNELFLNLAARWRIEAALWFETWLEAVSVQCRRRRPRRV